MRQIYSETPDFANLTSYVADYQSPFFQKSKTAENGKTRNTIQISPTKRGSEVFSSLPLVVRSIIERV